MATVAAAVVLAVFVVPRPWGLALIAGAIAWEILEKVFWFYRTKGFPLAVGPEAMIGQPVDVIAACRPDGKVRLSNERWNAKCPQGADIGETVIVDRVERLTLIVSAPTNSGWQGEHDARGRSKPADLATLRRLCIPGIGVP